MIFTGSGLRPFSSSTIAAAAILAWLFAMLADFGIAGADSVASPSTCTPFTAFDSMVRQSTSHQRLLVVIRPAFCAMSAARCGGHHVQHVALDVVELELDGARGAIDVHRAHVATVLEDSGVEIAPGALEQAPLGGNVRVGIEHQHLGARLRLLEIGRDHARALVGPRRASVRRHRDGEDVDPAVAHLLELLAQRRGLRTGFPGVQHVAGLHRRLVALHVAEIEVDAGRDDQPLVGQVGAAREAHLLAAASIALTSSRTTCTPCGAARRSPG